MVRKEIYKILDGERTYQEMVWGPDGERRKKGTRKWSKIPVATLPEFHTVGDFICFMEHYMLLARQELSMKPVCGPALHMLRKVTALGIACFEQHGVPPRVLEKR